MSKKSGRMYQENEDERMKRQKANRKYWAELEIENKYGIKPADIKRMRVIAPKKTHKEPFWWNDVVKKWCLSYTFSLGDFEMAEYWMGFSKDRTIDYYCWLPDLLMDYNFENFLDESEIENEFQRAVQKAWLYRLNWLLDEKVVEAILAY